MQRPTYRGDGALIGQWPLEKPAVLADKFIGAVAGHRQKGMVHRYDPMVRTGEGDALGDRFERDVGHPQPGLILFTQVQFGEQLNIKAIDPILGDGFVNPVGQLVKITLVLGDVIRRTQLHGSNGHRFTTPV